MQLNRYIAHAGLCSRRKALELIELGFISVNNEVQDKPYFRVQDGDIVKFKTKIIKPAEKKYYLYSWVFSEKSFWKSETGSILNLEGQKYIYRERLPVN